jgi:hypothetical protein
MSYVYTAIAFSILGAVAYALIVRKNPKVQADVATAATQAQALKK